MPGPDADGEMESAGSERREMRGRCDREARSSSIAAGPAGSSGGPAIRHRIAAEAFIQLHLAERIMHD